MIESKEILLNKLAILEVRIGRIKNFFPEKRSKIKVYEKEIEEIKVLLEKLSKDELPRSFEVEWTDIQFWNGYIRVLIYGTPSKEIPFSKSKRSFEFIKPSFHLYDLKPLEITMLKDDIQSIKNINEIDSALALLNVQDDVCDFFNDGNPERVRNIQTKLDGIPNKEIVRFYKLNKRNVYLRELSEKQSIKFKIVPVVEACYGPVFDTLSQDSFIFTFNTGAKVFLVWESLSTDKATYIFGSNFENYNHDIQRLFDYISSDRKRKRSSITANRAQNPLKFLNRAIHTNLPAWLSTLRMTMKNK